VTWCALRHSFGSQAFAAGVPLDVVQQWMGHSTITMTMRYVHTDAKSGDWIEKLAAEKRHHRGQEAVIQS
jgi:integrase